jgi:putative phage-type endonuclease
METPVIEQLSDAWFAAKLGKSSASRIKDIVAKTKSGYSTSRQNYAAKLMLERITGRREETYVNSAMEWGVTYEPLARMAYSIATGNDVEEVGFIDHPTISMTGASPDGLISTDGVLELKCPITATHINWAIAGKVPPEHASQMMWQMACTGREWCDFASFDPRMDDNQQLFIRRLYRDDKIIEELEREVMAFNSEVDALVEACNTIKWF